MVRKNNPKKVSELIEGEGKRKSGPIMGIDVHKNMLAYCILTEKKIITEDEVKNDFIGIQGLIKLCKENHVSSVAVESTAQYHFKLLYKFLAENIPVLVANPQQTKSTQGKKTDKFDARRIAIAHRDGRLKPSVLTGEEIMSLRKSNRQLLKLINDATKIKQRLNQLFHLKEFKHGRLLKSDFGLKLLELTTREMITKEKINEILPVSSKRMIKEEVIKALQEFQGRLNEIEKISLGNEVMQLQLIEIAKNRQRMAYYAMARKNIKFLKQMKLLLTIAGVGPDTAATIVAEIADISYFPSPSKLAKWAGLAPRVYQSGHRKHVTGRIHKGGNKFLRRAVVLACQNIHAKGHESNPLKQFIIKKKESMDSYWKAICAGARKLLVMIWHMLKKGITWTRPKLTKELTAKLEKVLLRKVTLFENKTKKYRKAWEKLSSKSTEAFETIIIIQNDPRMLLKTLINSV